jgi:3-oxoacyl-[acyl-carrier-protein] synthase-3
MAIKFNQEKYNARVISIGAYRPKRVVPNSEIVDLIDSSDEWIIQRTGIKTRHYADKNETLIDMSYEASKIALERANLTGADIDLVIFSTITYPYQTPSAATELLIRIGNDRAPAFDISAACAGFSYGIGLANDAIRNGTAKNVLVVGAEKLSDFTNPYDRATAFIFADGAGAVVISRSEEQGIGPTVWGSNPENREAIMTRPSWLVFKDESNLREKLNAGEKVWPDIEQEGQKVFRWAVYSVAKVCQEAIEVAGIKPEELSAFIPHQANERIIDSLAKSAELPENVLVARDIQDTGNTSAASIPLAMDRLLAEHPELHGKKALLVGFGAGLVFAGQVIELP